MTGLLKIDGTCTLVEEYWNMEISLFQNTLSRSRSLRNKNPDLDCKDLNLEECICHSGTEKQMMHCFILSWSRHNTSTTYLCNNFTISHDLYMLLCNQLKTEDETLLDLELDVISVHFSPYLITRLPGCRMTTNEAIIALHGEILISFCLS